MANSAWGIDLGNRALKAVKLVREGDRIRVDDFEVIEHEQILSVAGDNKESMVQTALANFVARKAAKGSSVGVAVSGQQSFARFIKLPPVEPKKIPEIVRFEAIQQIPFPLDDVEWSYQLFQDPDSPDVEVGIFAMKKDLVNRHIAAFTDLGLNVQVVQMHPLAVYNGMYFDGRVGATTMFMDCGAENTDLIIADGQTVWLRTLPIGGNNFTEALAKSFKLSFAKAEDLKRNAATSKYAKQIFQAMRPVFGDLVAEVQRSIGFYASVHRDARIQKIVAQGSTFQLPGLQKYLQQNMQLPVEKLDSFKAIPPADAKLATGFSEHAISLAGAYGLALQALGEAKIVSSLLPERIKRQKMWQEKMKWFGAAAAAMLLVSLGTAGLVYYGDLSWQRNEALRTGPDGYETIFRTAQSLSNEWDNTVGSAGGQVKEKLQNLHGVYGYHELWPSIMRDILATVPAQDFDRLKTVKREERQQILIDSIQAEYSHDLTEILKATEPGELMRLANLDTAASRMGGGGGGVATQAPAWTRDRRLNPVPTAVPSMGTDYGMPVETPKRGYLVIIRGSTPHKDQDDFIRKALVEVLRAKNAEAQVGQEYYVARVDLVESKPRTPVGGDNAGLYRAPGRPAFQPPRPAQGALVPPATAAPQPPPGGWTSGAYGGGRGSGGAAAPAPGRPTYPGPSGGNYGGGGGRGYGGRAGFANPAMPEEPEIDPKMDRFIPTETIEKDREFTVLMVVALDPPAAKAAETTLGE